MSSRAVLLEAVRPRAARERHLADSQPSDRADRARRRARRCPHPRTSRAPPSEGHEPQPACWPAATQLGDDRLNLVVVRSHARSPRATAQSPAYPPCHSPRSRSADAKRVRRAVPSPPRPGHPRPPTDGTRRPPRTVQVGTSSPTGLTATLLTSRRAPARDWGATVQGVTSTIPST